MIELPLSEMTSDEKKMRKDEQFLLVKEQSSSERKSKDATAQSQRQNPSIPQLALHKVHSHDE